MGLKEGKRRLVFSPMIVHCLFWGLLLVHTYLQSVFHPYMHPGQTRLIEGYVKEKGATREEAKRGERRGTMRRGGLSTASNIRHICHELSVDLLQFRDPVSGIKSQPSVGGNSEERDRKRTGGFC